MLYAEIFLVWSITTSALEMNHYNKPFYDESEFKLYQNLQNLFAHLSECDFSVITQSESTTFQPFLLRSLVHLLNIIHAPLKLRHESANVSENNSNSKRFKCKVYIGFRFNSANESKNDIASAQYSVSSKGTNLMRDFYMVFLNGSEHFQIKDICDFAYNFLLIDFEGQPSNYRLKMIQKGFNNIGQGPSQVIDFNLGSKAGIFSRLAEILQAERFTMSARTVFTPVPPLSKKPLSGTLRSSWYPEILKTADFVYALFKVVDTLAQRHNFTVLYTFSINDEGQSCNHILYPIPNVVPESHSQVVFSNLESWRLMYTKSKTGSRNPLRNLVAPFDTEVWIMLLIVVALITILSKGALKTRDIWESLEIITAPLVSQIQTKRSTSMFKYTAWLLLAILITNFYLAKLTCSFVSPTRIIENKALQELIHEGYKLIFTPTITKHFTEYLNSVKYITGETGINNSTSFEVDSELLEFLNQGNYNSLMNQAAEWGNGSFATLERKSFSDFISKIFSKVLNTSVFVTSHEFFVAPTYWQFSLPDNDAVMQSFKTLQDSGVIRFWEAVLKDLLGKKMLISFRHTFPRYIELQKLNLMYFMDGQATTLVVPEKLGLQQSLISGIFQFWKILLGFGVLIVVTEILWFNTRGCVQPQRPK
ncbi:unnamed protein product [Allacma fusca]|uniref:Ionotropic receptor n=1 Tax=Allacma fusca TaxID=39272 RepID=A0A8J2K825_9HEXA|nr:unnamed protein product [Allacma fusca]